jgi:hypothetical protein
MTARVPHSMMASSRSWGWGASPLPPGCRPSAARFAAEAGTPASVASQAASRSPNARAPGSPAASGPRSLSKSSSKNIEPSLLRALHSAAADGTASPVRCRTPCDSDRITDRYPAGAPAPSEASRHIPSTK